VYKEAYKKEKEEYEAMMTPKLKEHMKEKAFEKRVEKIKRKIKKVCSFFRPCIPLGLVVKCLLVTYLLKPFAPLRA
jgi:hypothetical protein